MRFSKRHRLYAIAIGGLLLALWLRPTPEAPATVLAAAPHAAHRSSSSMQADGIAALSAVAGREGRMPAGLFAVDAPLPPQTHPVELPPVGPPPVPELRLLGWVLSDKVPWVSVTVGNEGYALQPGEQAESLYRYDGVQEGTALFTYLPDGTRRQYPISDVQISE